MNFNEVSSSDTLFEIFFKIFQKYLNFRSDFPCFIWNKGASNWFNIILLLTIKMYSFNWNMIWRTDILWICQPYKHKLENNNFFCKIFQASSLQKAGEYLLWIVTRYFIRLFIRDYKKKNWQQTCSGDVRRLAATQTPVKDQQLTQV